MTATPFPSKIRNMFHTSRLWRFFLLLLVLLLAGLVGCGSPPPPPQNVILVSLDTTRKDHLTTYGYHRDTAPKLDALAQESFVFMNAVAQWTTTNPTHSSMFSSLYPHTHGVGSNTRQLDQEHITLAEILKDAGFSTGGFVSGYPLRLAADGLGQGFDVWDANFKKMRRNGRLTVDNALAWLKQRTPDERYFLFLHLYDAHGPYRPQEGYEGLFKSENQGRQLVNVPGYQLRRVDEGKPQFLNDYIDRYDGLIRYQDDLVADLLASADLEKTIVLVTADHGETLGERTRVLDHGKNLFEEQTAIPMILHVPGMVGGRVRQIAEQVDFLPTLVDLLGLTLPEGMTIQGENLAPVMRQVEDEEMDDLAFSSVRARAKSHADRGYFLNKEERIHAVRSMGWKFILYPGIDEEYLELYDLRQDPGELDNLAADNPALIERLRQALDAWEDGRAADEAPEMELSAEDAEKLRSLGYLGN